MRTVLVRKSDGVVAHVLDGWPIPAEHIAAEPSHWSQFDHVPWDDAALPDAPEPGDTNVTSTTFTKRAARLAREADDAAEPTRRAQATAVVNALEAIAASSGTLTGAQLSAAVRQLATAAVFLIKRVERMSR